MFMLRFDEEVDNVGKVWADGMLLDTDLEIKTLYFNFLKF